MKLNLPKLNSKQVFKPCLIGKSLIFSAGIFLAASPTIAQNREAPTKQYAQGQDVPLVWILDEWHNKNPQVPLYVCVCTKSECDNSKTWPFRRYSLTDVMPALGNFNRSSAQKLGFSCGQVSPKELQGIGG